MASATRRGCAPPMGLEQPANLQVVAQVARLRGDLHHLHRQTHHAAISRGQRGSLLKVVVGNNDLGRPEFPEQRHAALLHRFDLDVNPLATRAHGGGENRRLVGQCPLHHASRRRHSARGNGLGKMQAHEHLVKLRFKLRKVLEVIEAQLVAHRPAGNMDSKRLHRAQGGRGQSHKDAWRARLGQNQVPQSQEFFGSNS